MSGKPKSKSLFFIMAVLAMSLLAMPASVQAAIMSDSFYGYLTIDGEVAPVGTQVRGMIGGTDHTSNPPYYTSVLGQYGSTTLAGKFQVQGDTSGQTITFEIKTPLMSEFVVADKTATTFGGSNNNLDLNIYSPGTHILFEDGGETWGLGQGDTSINNVCDLHPWDACFVNGNDGFIKSLSSTSILAGHDPYSGNRFIGMWDCDTNCYLEKMIDTSGYDSLLLDFYFFGASSNNNGDDCFIEVANNPNFAGFLRVFDASTEGLRQSNKWDNLVKDISNYISTTTYIRVYGGVSFHRGDPEYCDWDDIKIIGIKGTPPPQPVCGDLNCDVGEDRLNCPSDCVVCTDGFCDAGEDRVNCPEDCASCGDLVCSQCTPKIGKCEDKLSCPQDCIICGDGICEGNEDWQNCPSDCPAPTPEVKITGLTASPSPTDSGIITTLHVTVQETVGVDALNNYIECGIFKKSYVESLFGFSVFGEQTVDACVSTDNFVGARSFGVQAGTSGEMFFELEAPTRSSQFSDGSPNWDGTTWKENDFYAVCGLYDTCGNDYITKNGDKSKVTATNPQGAWIAVPIIVKDMAICNDGFCAPTENSNDCPQDCVPVCGNNVCELGENYNTCQNDCDIYTATDCRNPNLACVPGDNCELIAGQYQCITPVPDDCRTHGCGDNEICEEVSPDTFTCTGIPATCGNFICETGETYISCPNDCDRPVICGDDYCDTDAEDFLSCETDCPPPAVCGDGICQEPENADNCVQDCGTPADFCGDDVCGLLETTLTCELDCPVFTPTEPQIFAEDLAVSVVDDTIFGIVKIKNNGADMTEEWIIEMRPKVASNTLSIFGVSDERMCDTRFPQYVHRRFKLASGQSAVFTLQSTVADGLYNVDFISAKKCLTELTAFEAENYDQLIRTQPFTEPERKLVAVGNTDFQVQTNIDPSIVLAALIGSGGTVGAVYASRRRR